MGITGPGPSLYESDASLGIETIPASLGSQYINNFDRYTKINTSNGMAIHIVAQNEISNEKIVRARNVLSHYLTNYPGSEYGADKSGVGDKISENGGVLILMNGSDRGKNPPVNGQPLYDDEIQVEGSSWYIEQDYTHRDATFEEILHFVHDLGIGVDGHNSAPGVLPDYQAEIRSAQENGLINGLWGIGASTWILELRIENSLSQEYLASVIDSYYGLWGAWSEDPSRGMWGIYTAHKRARNCLRRSYGVRING